MSSGKTLARTSYSETVLGCAASLRLGKGIEDKSGVAASEGSAAHKVCETALIQRIDCEDLIGTVIEMDGRKFTVDEDMATNCQVYVDYVRELAKGKQLLVETELDISVVTGEQGATGTSDAIIVGDGVIDVVDFKYGFDVVKPGPQLAIYGVSAAEQYAILEPVNKIRMHIVQPRVKHFATWEMDAEQMADFAGEVKEKVTKALILYDATYDEALGYATPGERQCKWCRARFECPALVAGATAELDEVAAIEQLPAVARKHKEFVIDTPEKLGKLYLSIPMLKQLIKVIEKRTKDAIYAGEHVPGLKLVETVGNREWSDKSEVLGLLKGMRLRDDQIYDQKLLSPTQMEELAKAGTIGPRQWNKLQDMIVREVKGTTIAKETDKRPAVQPVTSDELDDL